jgi:hypothetical protein
MTEEKKVNETSVTKMMISGESPRAPQDHQYPDTIKPAGEKEVTATPPPKNDPNQHGRHHHHQKPKEEENPDSPNHLLGGMHHRRRRSPPVSPEVTRRHHSPQSTTTSSSTKTYMAPTVEKEELPAKELLLSKFDIAWPEDESSKNLLVPPLTKKETALSAVAEEQPVKRPATTKSPHKTPSEHTLKQEVRAPDELLQFEIMAATSPLLGEEKKEQEEEETAEGAETEQHASIRRPAPLKRTLKQEMRARELLKFDILTATPLLEEREDEATGRAPGIEQQYMPWTPPKPTRKGGPKKTHPVSPFRLRSKARHDRHYVI